MKLNVIFVALALALSGTLSLRAADTNSLAALRAALQPKAASWGQVSVGTFTRTVSSARASGFGPKLAQLVAQRAASQAPGPPGPSPDPQQTAIKLLRDRAGTGVEVYLRPANRTVMQVRGQVLEKAAAGLARASEAERAEMTARNFLRANRGLLRLGDPDGELRLESHQRDVLSGSHLKFSQMFQDIPVWPAGLSVHLDLQGDVYLLDGAYSPTPAGIDARPAIDAAEAAERAKAAVAPGQDAQAWDMTLIIYAPLDQAPRLAWKLTVSASFMNSWLVIIDAVDGRILDRITQCLDSSAPGSSKDLEGIVRNFTVWSAGGTFSLADTSKKMFNPAFDPIKDPHGVISIFDAREVTSQNLKTVFLVDSTSATTWLPEAVSALFNFGLTYDYYSDRLNRNSLDGKGGNIQAVVRVAQLDNAFWNGELKMMFFGNVRPYPVALDVVGHELAHGVTQNTADLIYELQPGALNEALSDIFGEMVEAHATGQIDWKLGEKLGLVFRDMKNPASIQINGLNRPYPAKMSEFVDLPNSNDSDHGGVHINSSIINHAYYLLAEGLNGAVGLADAEQIFYHCLTDHLQKQSQFIDARLGCVAAAEALFGAGSNQAKKVAEAFDAVEIFANPPTPDPSPIPAVQGPDSTLLISFDPFAGQIALGRREQALGDPIDGVALVESVKEARPAVSGDGSFTLFVDSADDLCLVNTDNPNSLQCLGFQGQVNSVAASPDGKLFAFVLLDAFTGQPDNKINVYDLVKNTTRTFELLAPVIDGSPVDAVLYADSLVFTSDSKQLVYDALTEIRFGGGVPVQRWNIARINLATETTTVLVPPLEGLDFGNPNLGRAGNRYLTFDARNTTTGNTTVINLDLFTGDFAEIATAGQGLGFPCFTGDESAVIFAARDPNASVTGFSLFKQPLDATRLAKNGAVSLWLPDATIGVIYRRGAVAAANALPIVTVTSPANNAIFPPLPTVEIQANASDTDGTVAKVEFYEGSSKLGEAANAPYHFTWSNVPAGNYRLIARAIDNLGAASDSAAVNITVGQSASASFRLGGTRLANNTLRLTLSGPAGNYLLQRSTNLIDWSDSFAIPVGATGSGSVDDPSDLGSSRRLFFRARKN